MNMRWLGLLIAAVSSCLLLAQAAGHAARPTVSCWPGHSHTLLRNAEVRVFRRGFYIYGCALSSRRSLLLNTAYSAQDSSSPGGGITRLRLAGHFLAAVSVQED